jgi:ABC-type transport system involved in multi-copper enzyme maturation permease subunit
MHLVRAELLKVRSTRLWVGMLLGALAFTVLISILLLSVMRSADAAEAGLRPILTPGDFRAFVFTAEGSIPFALVLAATMATTEFRYGTATLTYLATPSRARVLAGKSAAAAVVGLLIGLASAAAGLVVAVIWLAAHGDDVPFDATVLGAVGQVGLHAAYAALLALAFGALVRSQLVSILGLLGWLFILEPIATAIVPKLATWAPFAGVEPLFGSGETPTAPLFGWLGALGLAAAYVAVLSALAIAAERSRDV